MSAQTKYGYSTPIGAAGGIVDVAPHQIDTFLNEEENGVLKFGAGVVQGSKPGVNIALPKKAATAAKFEGITTNNRTTEYDLEGKLAVRMFILCYEVIKLNFKGFFKRVGIRSGSLIDKLRKGTPTSENGETSTSDASASLS